MRHPEAVALAVVEAIEIGSQMKYQLQQSHGEHDFNLIYANGRTATMEVTASMDESTEETISALRNRQGGPSVQRKLCKSDWYIHPDQGARINNIKLQIDRYLANVEKDGLTTFSSFIHAHEYESVRKIWNDLKVLGGSATNWNPSGYICISSPSSGGIVKIDAFTKAVHKEVEKIDNCKKLKAAQTEERHLFLYMHPRNYLPWIAFVDCELPKEPVLLPPEITHIWVATNGRSHDEYIVWRAVRDGCWYNCGPITLAVHSDS
ncbi:MAG: hypothetical protein HIU83_03810 [Proteobacteria bacterium]|nr:hypothetical protein [Pseudomonadota bacterium]